MSELAEEVAVEIQKKAPQLTWWRRMILIIVANAFGTLIGGGLLGFCAIVWTKANSTDELNRLLISNAQLDRAVREEFLIEVAKIKAQQDKMDEFRKEFIGPLSPDQTAPEATVEDVEAAKEKIQQRLDKAIYRENQEIK